MKNTVLANNSLIAQLNKDVENINKPELSDEKRALLLSEMVLSEGLKTETIKTLEAIATNSQNPALLVNLGKLYQSVGSNEQAEKTYLKAIELAKAVQEPVGQILAKAGLANLLNLQGKKKEAELLLEEVKKEIKILKAEDQQNSSSNCDSTCEHKDHRCGSCCRNGRNGRCVLIDGTNLLICDTLSCPE